MQVGEVVLTTNDVTKRSDKMKMGRVVVLMKMYTGFIESNNMMDALFTLAELTEALRDDGKVWALQLSLTCIHQVQFQPLDFLVTTTYLWFEKVKVPDSCKSTLLSGKETTRMFLWFSQTCQVI